MKYNWDSVLKEAINRAPMCESISDLASTLNIPRTTLTSFLNRRGITFADLLVDASTSGQVTIEKLTLQRSHLEKQVKHLRKQLGKRDWWRDTLLEAAAMMRPNYVAPPPLEPRAESAQSSVLMVSDVHIGQCTPAEDVGMFGEYNTSIALARFKETFAVFASITRHQAFPVDAVYVVLLGDLTDHGHLRPGHEGFVDMNPIKQALEGTNALIAALSMLAGQFPYVYVIGVPGNHGRVPADPRRADPTDNFDWLIYNIAKLALERQDNIMWNIPGTWYANFEIKGHRFFAIHGEDIISYVGFPWYGATRAARDYVAMFRLVRKRRLRRNPPQSVDEYRDMEIVPDYALLGHFHTQANWEAPDVEMMSNGTMPEVSIYGAKRRKTISRSSQRMFFVHQKYGMAMRCPIILEDITA